MVVQPFNTSLIN